jgi:hypothetical protein
LRQLLAGQGDRSLQVALDAARGEGRQACSNPRQIAIGRANDARLGAGLDQQDVGARRKRRDDPLRGGLRGDEARLAPRVRQHRCAHVEHQGDVLRVDAASRERRPRQG